MKLLNDFLLGKLKPIAVPATVDASKNTNGIDYSPTIPTTIAKAFSWTGSCFRRVAFVAAIVYSPSSKWGYPKVYQ
jgi:hypothetical protein